METEISFILPVFNERQSVKDAVGRVRKAGEESDCPFEIIVVDDGSDDGTGEILEGLNDIKVITHDTNQGYGSAIKTGIANAAGDLIAIVDSDNTYPIESFAELFREMDRFDMVVGARTGGKVHIPLLRRPAKWILQRLSVILTNRKIPDLNSGMMVFKKDIATRFMKLFPESFSFTTTLTIAAICNNYAVKYVPINYYQREGRSAIRPIRDFLGFFQLIIRLVIYFKPLNVFLPISLIFFIIGFLKMWIDFIRLNYFGVGAVTLQLMAFQILFLGLLADLIIKRTNL